MSGLELPGLVVGVVPIVFKAAVQAWKFLDDTLSFDGDAEDLIVRLETVKAHLGIWATKAGLTDGELVPVLVPFEDLIARTLARVRDLVAEVEQWKIYGLAVKEETGGLDSKGTAAAVIQMRRSLHAIITSSRSRKKLSSLVEKEALMQLRIVSNEAGVAHKVGVGTRRVRWAIRDKNKFEHFVDMLEKHVKGLQNFTVEDRKVIQQEGTRLALEIIRGLSEPDALSQLQHASGWDDDFSQIDVNALAQWKAIMLRRASTLGTTAAEKEDWSLTGSSLEDRLKTRFLRKGRVDPNVAYLFEKKEYDPNISEDLKDLMQDRVRKLVSLLGGSSTQRHLHTLQAVGYVDDPDLGCWWTVFRFPLGPMDVLGPNANEPLSLRKLYSSPAKPALEERYKLAKRLGDTFARLYGSDWMHKGINSSNVIFPQVYSHTSLQSFGFLQTALVQGFNYSRQLTQAQTIDRGKVLHDIESAVYRHPYYQGEAASGYQIHYDIYSLGLVLFEIALWGPLMDLLAAKFRPGKEPPVALSPDMRRFHELEAKELKRRVDLRVENELAYRVGTKYKNAVQWCLNLQGPVTAIEFYNTVAIPLDELCSQS